MFNYLISAGHQYTDLMFNYPLELVSRLYVHATKDETRRSLFGAHIAHMSGLTARDLDKEGARAVNKMWENFRSPLQKVLQDVGPKTARAASRAAKEPDTPRHLKMSASHSAANAFLSGGMSIGMKKE